MIQSHEDAGRVHELWYRHSLFEAMRTFMAPLFRPASAHAD